MRIAIIQHATIVGSFDTIDADISDIIDNLQDEAIDLIVFPEFFYIGGRSGDFAIKAEVLRGVEQRLEHLAKRYVNGPSLLLGTPRSHTQVTGTGVHNAAVWIHQGRVQTAHNQVAVPRIGVRDDALFFDVGTLQEPIVYRDTRIGVCIGNDLWFEATRHGRHEEGVAPASTIATSCDVLIHLDADPWYVERPQERLLKLQELARATNTWVLHANAVGTTQSILYDGRSTAISPSGAIDAQARAFHNDTLIIDTTSAAVVATPSTPPNRDNIQVVDEIWEALVYALRNNVQQSGFSDVVLGLSGGIDSALVAALAVDALGSEHVYGVALPSRFSSDHSLQDAADLAKNLKISYQIIAIESVHQALLDTLAPAFEGTAPSTAEENLQARARGVILMGLSNKFNRLLLATSNKSEFAVGYSTLYGDMCGAFSPLADVPKTLVYTLSRRFNERRGLDAIPNNTIIKPPSAELRPNQTDQDSLPDYDILDAILEASVVHNASAEELVQQGFRPEDVQRVLSLLYQSGYKRQQAAPGFMISRQALAIGRHFPSVGNFSSLNVKASR